MGGAPRRHAARRARPRRRRRTRRGPAALLERLAAELATLFAAPHRREAPILDARRGRRGAGAAPPAAARWRDLARRRGARPRARARRRTSSPRCSQSVEVRVGERAVARRGRRSPTRSRCAPAACARCFLCRLQERAFPAPARPEPFLGDDERRAINAASGLRLRAHEDVLGAERYLLYATVSRPERAPVPHLARRRRRGRARGALGVRRRRRAALRRRPARAPPPARPRRGRLGRRRRAVRARAPAGRGATPRRPSRERGRRAADPPRRARRAARPARRGRPRALETWASCPVKWFVERLLQPRAARARPRGDGPRQRSRTRCSRRRCAGSSTAAGLTPDAAARGARRGRERARRARATSSRCRSTRRGGARCAAAWRPTCCATSRRPRSSRHGVRARALRAARSTSVDAGDGIAPARPDRPHRRPRAGDGRGAALRLQGQDRVPGGEVGRGGALPARGLRARRAPAARPRARRRALPAARRRGPAPARRAARRRRPRPRRRRRATASAPRSSSSCSTRRVAAAVQRGDARPATARSSRGRTRAPGTAAAPTRRSAGARRDGGRGSSGRRAARSPTSRPTPSASATATCCSAPRPAAARRRCSSSASCATSSRTASRRGASSRSRSPRRPRASCATASASGCSSSASATSPARRRARGSRRSTASARGCCAATPSPPGLDPAFTVLDETVARGAARGGVGRARSRRWLSERGDAALDLAAAFTADRLRDGDRGRLRRAALARAHTQPRLPVPAARARARPDRAARAARRRRGRAGPATSARPSLRAAAALERCREVFAALAPGAVPEPGAARPGVLQARQHRRAQGRPECAAYLEEHARYAAACAAYRASRAAAELDALLDGYAAAYAAAKRARSGLDFDDLELLARDLLRRRAGGAPRDAGALRAGDGRRVPGLQPAAGRAVRPRRRAATSSSSATSCSRSTASATPTSRCSAARRAELATTRPRRRADAELPLARAGARRGQRRVRRPLRRRASGRSSPGRADAADDAPEVEVLRDRRRGLGGRRPRRRCRARRRWRHAEARLLAQRVADLVARRHAARGRRRAHALGHRPAGVRARAGGGRAADARRRRPRLLGPPGRPRPVRVARARWPTRATRSSSTACSPRRSSASRPTRSR